MRRSGRCLSTSWTTKAGSALIVAVAGDQALHARAGRLVAHVAIAALRTADEFGVRFYGYLTHVEDPRVVGHEDALLFGQGVVAIALQRSTRARAQRPEHGDPRHALMTVPSSFHSSSISSLQRHNLTLPARCIRRVVRAASAITGLQRSVGLSDRLTLRTAAGGAPCAGALASFLSAPCGSRG